MLVCAETTWLAIDSSGFGYLSLPISLLILRHSLQPLASTPAKSYRISRLFPLRHCLGIPRSSQTNGEAVDQLFWNQPQIRHRVLEVITYNVFVGGPLFLNIPHNCYGCLGLSVKSTFVQSGRERRNHRSGPRAIEECVEPLSFRKLWRAIVVEWASLHHVTPRHLGYDLCYQQWKQSRTAHLFIVTKRKNRSMFRRMLMKDILNEKLKDSVY